MTHEQAARVLDQLAGLVRDRWIVALDGDTITLATLEFAPAALALAVEALTAGQEAENAR